jgi:methionyl aminopeptidase
MYNKVKTPEEIIAIRESGRQLALVLKKIEEVVEVGMTGLDIDELAREELKKLGGIPAFLGYQGFPNTICISINDAVVHGIPNSIPFESGDVVGFDFGVIYDGMVTDAARSVIIGQGTPELEKLLKTTKKSLDAGINKVKNGCSTGDIAQAVQEILDASNYGIVRDLVGHGVGHHVHEGPDVPNYGSAGTGAHLKTGMTIAIEPMATLGDYQVRVDSDGWTIRTLDGSTSAHFEDTILITEYGAEILTRL